MRCCKNSWSQTASCSRTCVCNHSESEQLQIRTLGKYMFEVDATLVVNEASFSSTTAPPHSCTPKPPDSSNLLWLCAVIPLVILLVVYFCKHKKKCESGADVESSVPMKPFTSLKASDPACAKERTGKTSRSLHEGLWRKS